jgi:hypothetical protein
VAERRAALLGTGGLAGGHGWGLGFAGLELTAVQRLKLGLDTVAFLRELGVLSPQLFVVGLLFSEFVFQAPLVLKDG